MKIAVVGSCQAKGLAFALASRVDESCFVEGIERAGVRTDEKRKEIADRIRSYDLILSHPFTFQPGDGPLRPRDLKTLGPQVIDVPSLYFTGFHPDSVYIRDGAAFLASPHSDHHSALIAGAFLAGVPKERIEGIFNNFVFASLGYFDEFGRAAENLDSQWSTLEPGKEGVAKWLLGEFGVFMHTINHPHINVLDQVAKAIIDRRFPHLGRPPKTELHDALAQVAVWPIYPDIANKLGVKGNYVFRRGVASGIQFTLHEMIDRSYEIYEKNFDIVRANQRVTETAGQLKELLARDKGLHLRPAEETTRTEYVKSEEMRSAIVEALYRAILQRPPDESGREAALKHLSGDLDSKTLTQAMNIFIDSKEGAPKLMERARSLIGEG